MGKADLHIHTTASDGSCRPVEVIRLAVEKKLNTIAITDHDTIGGYLQARPEAEKEAVRLIPGVEFTARYSEDEIHILAYHFQPNHVKMERLLQHQRNARLDRMDQILNELRTREGIDISLDEVKGEAGNLNVGRPHVARILVKRKIVASVPEAFIRYLGSSLVEKIQTEYATVDELAAAVQRAGGVTVLAHPGVIDSRIEITDLLEAGLDGIECIHPAHSFDEQVKFTALAEQRRLLVTGGSDFHGSGRKYDPWFGIVTLGEQRLADMDRMAARRKKLEMNIES